jgi:hypothetical protein
MHKETGYSVLVEAEVEAEVEVEVNVDRDMKVDDKSRVE